MDCLPGKGHSLRHSYITRLLRSGVSVPVTQRLARHKTPDLTLRVYAHANKDEQRAALGAAFGPTATNGRFPSRMVTRGRE
ncbi:MAG: tyrosine-type recombinase/integrase [Planctomycetota bacterium]